MNANFETLKGQNQNYPNIKNANYKLAPRFSLISNLDMPSLSLMLD